MPDDLKGAMAEVDTAKSQLDQSYANLRGASPARPASPAPMKKWTVTMKDGTVYRGVQAPTSQDAAKKMAEGPQGPLGKKPLVPLAPGMGEVAPPGPMGTGEALSRAAATATGPLGMAAEIASPSKPPTTGREIAGDLVPLAAALIPGGRTATRFLRTAGANILGRGVVEAGAEALSPTGQGPLSAGVSGAIKGVLPGIVQGGVGLALGPGKGTLQVEKAAKALKKAVSPEVGALIDPGKPAQLLSRRTAQKMERAAGGNLDKMESEIEKALGSEFRVRTGTQAPPNLPPEIRKQLGLRAGEPVPFGNSAPGGQGQTFAEVRAEIKRLREIAKYDKQTSAATSQAAKKDAAKLEQTLLAQMPPAVANRYRTALEAHARDMDAVRWVRAQQQRNSVAGGANPIDRPGLAEAETAMTKASSRPGKALVHGSVATLEALKGFLPGAGYHGARATEGLSGAGPLRPGNPSQTIPAITRGILGAGTAQAQKPLMPPPEAQ